MKQELEQAVAAVVKDVFGVEVAVELTRPDEQFGDYATNVALQMAKKIGENPREVAEHLAGRLREKLSTTVKSIDIAGPGFLNLTLTDEALTSVIGAEPAKPLAGKKILVEYSDPNPFKPLHAGHLYTTLVGDTLARLIQNAGAETIRLNYGGDVGLHVAKCMWAIQRIYTKKIYNDDEFENDEEKALARITAMSGDDIHIRAGFLGSMYAGGHTKYEDDEVAKAEIVAINRRIYQLHEQADRDSTFAKVYWLCRQWSYDYFAILYKELEIIPFDRFIPESEVTPLGVDTVNEQLEKGVFERSEGAVVFDGEKYGLHTRVFINGEGLPTYETKDVGLSLTKWNDYHFDESIIITANEQAQYMQVVIKAIEQFAPEPAQRTKHLTHGVVKLQGGVKMSSRKGNVVTALQILEAARQAGQETGTNPSEETILAAVKYAFAKNRIGGDIAYDPKESIALEGNSGPYLQYAYARACSILAKAANAPTSRTFDYKFNDSERRLVRKMTEYQEVVQRATEELLPHHICTYLFELAQEFNRFYETNKVIGSDQEVGRLTLVSDYAGILKNGLELLGITAPEKM